MGAVYRKTVTKQLPTGAEVFARKGERFARWRDAKGTLRTAPLTTGRDGHERIVIEVGTFTAKYRDGTGQVVETATGCRDEAAPRTFVLLCDADLAGSGILRREIVWEPPELHFPCGACQGRGEYVGLLERQTCATCGGRKTVPV